MRSARQQEAAAPRTERHARDAQVELFHGTSAMACLDQPKDELFEYRLALRRGRRSERRHTELASNEPRTSSGCCRIMMLRKCTLSALLSAVSAAEPLLPSPRRRTLVDHMVFQSTSLHRARMAQARCARLQSCRCMQSCRISKRRRMCTLREVEGGLEPSELKMNEWSPVDIRRAEKRERSNERPATTVTLPPYHPRCY